MRGYLFLLAFALFGLVLVARPWAEQPAKNNAKTFQGYWMGIDPLDGGDSRRGFVQQPNGTFAMVGRDSFFTLCNNTDRGLAEFDDGTIVERGVLKSDDVKLTCFNTGATVMLKVKYVLIDDSAMTEFLTDQNGTPIDTIIFHKVSQK